LAEKHRTWISREDVISADVANPDQSLGSSQGINTGLQPAKSLGHSHSVETDVIDILPDESQSGGSQKTIDEDGTCDKVTEEDDQVTHLN